MQNQSSGRISSTSDSASKHVQSVSAGGESVTIDTNAAKAEQQYEDSKNLTNIANRRVRVRFGAIVGARP